MLAWINASLWRAAAALFVLRIVAIALDAMAIVVIARGLSKMLAWLLSFAVAALFLIALSLVTQGLGHPLLLLAYGLGYASGTALGMTLERRLLPGHLHLRIISPRRGHALAESLRSAGFAVTEVPAQGRDGAVTLLNCGVAQRHLPSVLRLVQRVDPEAFVTAEVVRPLRRGIWDPFRGLGGRA